MVRLYWWEINFHFRLHFFNKVILSDFILKSDIKKHQLNIIPQGYIKRYENYGFAWII